MFAGVAQLVERNLAKVEVESSSLFSRSNSKGSTSKCCPFLLETVARIGRGNKAVMYRIANPASPVRLRAAPPSAYFQATRAEKLSL